MVKRSSITPVQQFLTASLQPTVLGPAMAARRRCGPDGVVQSIGRAVLDMRQAADARRGVSPMRDEQFPLGGTCFGRHHTVIGRLRSMYQREPQPRRILDVGAGIFSLFSMENCIPGLAQILRNYGYVAEGFSYEPVELATLLPSDGRVDVVEFDARIATTVSASAHQMVVSVHQPVMGACRRITASQLAAGDTDAVAIYDQWMDYLDSFIRDYPEQRIELAAQRGTATIPLGYWMGLPLTLAEQIHVMHADMVR
ncbi:MAG: hypothetical protein HYV02_08295 [Deltaproteobacteria bacterium]|nr:hypothetical protein [Deltaproteobacteria bacterium]